MNSKIINYLAIFCLFLMGSQLTAQEGTVRGTMTDKSSGEVLMFANVYVADNPTLGTDTDIDGAFEIKLAPGTYNLKACLLYTSPSPRD